MEYVAGIDVGSRTTKCVVVDAQDQVQGEGIAQTGAFLTQAAEKSLEQAMAQAGINRKDVSYIASTGWGRHQVPFRDIQITDITCHARSAVHLFPGTRTVLDIGAQNTRAIKVEASGRVLAFRMNNRCASGAGRFLERTAMALELPPEDIGTIALRSHQPERISSICAVMAESEVINMVSHEARVEDILAGVHHALAERIVSLVRQVGAEPEITLTGGVARNVGMVDALQKIMRMQFSVSPRAIYAGAIGAALLGWARMRRKRWTPMPVGVRPLTQNDVGRIAEIDGLIAGVPARIDYWENKLQSYLQSGEPAVGLESNGQLLGYMMGFVRSKEFGMPEQTGWVELMGVDPRHHGRGIGRQMMQALFNYFRESGVKEVYTLVDERQDNLQAFFKSMNFEPAPMKSFHLML